jgi:hypothetical protein
MANTIITPAIFSNEVIRNLDRDTVFLAHTNRAYEGELKQRGDTVRVQTLPTLTFTASTITGAGDLTNSDVGVGPGGAIAASDFAITLENLIIDKYTEKRVTLPNIQEVQSNLSLEQKVASRFSEGMGTLLDDQVVNQILVTQVADIPEGNKIDSGAPTAATSGNIYARVIAMRTALRKQNVKVSNMKLFVSTDVEGLLLQATQFTSGSNDAFQVVKTGYIGMIGGVPVYVTTALDASKEMIMMAEGSVNAVLQVSDTKVTEGVDGFYTNVLAQIIWGMKIFGENAKAIAIHYNA